MIYIHSLLGYGCSIKRGSDMVEKFLPDFDDCVLELTLEEAIAEARREALWLLKRFREDGIGIPEPSAAEEIMEQHPLGVIAMMDLELPDALREDLSR